MSGPKLEIVDCDIPDDKTLVNLDTIGLLERMLDAAKEGLIQEVLIAGILADKNICSAWSDTMSCPMRLGLLEMLKLRWFDEFVEDHQVDDDSE